MEKKSVKVYLLFFKPLIDIIVSIIGLMVLFPIFIITTISLAIANHGTPFYFQKRPGKGGVIFKIIKFKTMSDKKDAKGILLPDNMRITKIGGVIRKLSIDEIPQLLNVLKGEMSIVGPRPLLPEYLPLYNEYQRKRHNVKPGITGWAQVNGRNAIDWSVKFDLDVWYVRNLSFKIDLRIMLLTIRKILIKDGVNQNKNNTMQIFTGNE